MSIYNMCLFLLWLVLFGVLLLVLFKLYIKITTGWCKSQVCLKGKTIIVTGANTGIGYETAMDLAKRGGKVILACRSQQKAKIACAKIKKETRNKDVLCKIVDFASLASVKKFAAEIIAEEERLDILVNNVGVYTTGDKISEDGLLLLMQINYFAPFLLTNLLLDLLRKSSGRIVNVSSIVAKYSSLSLDDLKSLNTYIGRQREYHRTKLCNKLFTIELASKLRDSGATTYSLHPGIVRTGFFNNLTPYLYKLLVHISLIVFFKNPLEGAQTSIHCAVEDGIEKYSGEHFHDCHVVRRYRSASSEELARKLWTETMKILKIE